MSKQQRLYYENMNKKRIEQDLIEHLKLQREQQRTIFPNNYYDFFYRH